MRLQKESAPAGQRERHHLGPVLCRLLVLMAPWTATGKTAELQAAAMPHVVPARLTPVVPGRVGLFQGVAFRNATAEGSLKALKA